MQRALLPNVLASLGLVFILLATVMPLFKWDISTVNKDFPPAYELHLKPSPWTTKLGESLDDNYFFKNVRVTTANAICTNDEDFLDIQRSPNERSLELMAVNANGNVPWLISSSFIVVILSGIYIWWLLVWHDQHPISSAIAPIVISVVFFCLLIAVLRLVGPRLSAPQYLMISDQCQGALTLNARLSKIHYETLIILILGILGELSALGIMLRQFIRAIIQGKESSRSAVG